MRHAQIRDAIRRHEYEWTLRIPAHHSRRSGVEAGLGGPACQTLANQTLALIRDIKQSAYIVKPLQVRWVAQFETLTKIDSKDALDIIIDFKISFSAWKLKNRPEEKTWDISNNSKIWLFDSQTLLIECKVDRIRWFLESEIRNYR